MGFKNDAKAATTKKEQTVLLPSLVSPFFPTPPHRLIRLLNGEPAKLSLLNTRSQKSHSSVGNAEIELHP